jgi:hypothetical protein
MKQAMKRKIKRVERTDDVDFEVGYKRDPSLTERVDATLARIDCALNDNGCRSSRS